MASEFKVYTSGSRAAKPKPIKAKILLKDPLVERSLPHLQPIEVSIENQACIGPGPTSSRVAVVDYNGHLDQVFEAARLHSSGDRFKIRGGERETDFAFHQVNVWATIHKTLDLLEASDVLGRRVPWAFPGGRLKVLPHAGYWENAYYDRSTGALHFFYFEGKSGETIFTCLSHDIITHELGHAILDGLKPYYNEVSSAATAGFHEYFGDAIALTSALRHRDLLVELAGRSDTVLSPNNVVARIAQEFGSGLSEEYGSLQDAYLRSAQNEKTMDDLDGVMEEHDYSEVMTGAYYDFLEGLYQRLMKEKAKSNGQHRVAALFKAADIVRRMLLRALDYCPPVDIDFPDYAKAVHAADRTAYPVDSQGYRELWHRVAIRRKVFGKTERMPASPSIRNSDLLGLDIETIASSKTDAYDFVDANRAALAIPPTANVEVINLYRTKKISSDDYRVPEEIVIEFVWPSEIRLSAAKFGVLRGSLLPLWCGGTLVFNQEGNLLHYAAKADTSERQGELARYAEYLIEQGYLGLDDGERGIGATSQDMKKVVGRLENGRLSLRRNPAMRHMTCQHVCE